MALLKQICVIADPSASVLTQAISGLFVAQPTGIPSATTITQTEVRRRFMCYPQLQAFVVSVTGAWKGYRIRMEIAIHGSGQGIVTHAIAGDRPPLPSYFNIQRGNPDLAVPRMKSSISS